MTPEFVVGLIVGLVVSLVAFVVLSVMSRRRLEEQHAADLSARESAVAELRRELADDKETNRRLRHELAVRTPNNLLELATTADMERNTALGERDQALEQLNLVERDLATARSRLTAQEAKLRRYREALQEIRMFLEAQGRERASLDGATSMLETTEIDAADVALASTAVAEGTVLGDGVGLGDDRVGAGEGAVTAEGDLAAAGGFVGEPADLRVVD